MTQRVRLKHWSTLDFEKELDFDEFVDFTELLSDTAISPYKEHFYSVYNKDCSTAQRPDRKQKNIVRDFIQARF